MIEPNKIYTGRSTIRMYNCDCMELMQSGKTWDLAIVDPPYGININMNMGRRKGKRCDHKVKKWDDSTPDNEYFDALLYCSENRIIWGGNYFPLPLTKSWIFWDKLVPDGVSFADGELAWTSFDKTLVKATIPYSGFNGSEGKIHPTQKPVKLYKWLIHNYAQPNQTILDTHGGSMSIAIACWDLGFDLDICELDTDYFNQAVKRFENHIAQTTLF